jgi:hypothetical protein
MRPEPESSSPAIPADIPAWLDLIRAVALLVGLLAAVAVGLRALDQLPAMATGVARGVRRVDSVAALEHHTSHRMPVPTYFPDTLKWPPSDVLVVGGTAASLSFRSRLSADTWMIVAMAVGDVPIPSQLLPPASPLQAEMTTVQNVSATVERLRDLDGVMWYQLTWHASGTTRLLRYRGTLDEIMLIANSMDERGR